MKNIIAFVKKHFSKATIVEPATLRSTVISDQPIKTSFEKIVLEARVSNNFMPVWESFVNTEFYVITIPLDSGSTTSDFKFSLFNSPQNKNGPTVLISEEINRLANNSSSDKAIRIRGANLVNLLNPEVGILIALEDGGFGLPKEQVQWLRASIQPVH